METLYNRILDSKELKKIQDEFCAVAGVYAFCVDGDGTKVTEMSGSREDRERLAEEVPEEQLMSLFHRLSDSTLEDQAIEETKTETVKYAAVCAKDDGRTVMAWLICGVMEDVESDEGRAFAGKFEYRVTEHKFLQAMDLLGEISRHIVGNKVSMESAMAQSRKERFSKEEMEALLRRNAAMAEIVQLLDSDDPIEAILLCILQTVGKYLDIDSAYLCSIHNEDADRMDVIAEWCNDGVVSSFDQTQDQPRPAYLRREKPLVLSANGNKDSYAEDMNRAKLKALAAIPITLRDEIGMYACFEKKRTEHIWELEEIKFLNDSVKVMQSILTKRIQKNSLAGSYAALEEVLGNIGSSIYVRDRENGRILFVNRSLRRNFRRELEQNLLADIFESKILKDSDKGSVEVCLEDGGFWYDLFYKNIKWVDGREVLMCSVYDITEKKMYQQKIERQAYTDYLTGLYNRMCCERDLAKYVDMAKDAGSEGAVLYMDLDDFKHINDSLGHQYGDLLLRSIAHGIQSIQGIHNSCYRMGGDEFVIIVPPARYKRLEKILKEIRTVFDKPWFLKDTDCYCTMSMGIVHFPQEKDGVQALIRKADIAMYEAKRSGKNRMVFYSDNIKSDSDKRLDMEKNMRDAAIDGFKEFEVFYQPIIDIQEENVCVGAEALIRWRSEELGFMSPVDFIPLAEYLGLINPIGNYVLQRACKACKGWNDNGHPDYKVNVNLSVVQLLQPDIVENVEKVLKESGLDPQNLTLEVTEGLAINDLEKMKEILLRIKRLGVRIALDDFGTGYSSLSHIRELPFDVIKVDQSFVKDLAEDNYSKSFIRMVADLAEAIGVSICVEGIETKKQYKVLEGMKVRMIQGYYFDKPMQEKDFEKKYVKERKNNEEDIAGTGA